MIARNQVHIHVVIRRQLRLALEILGWKMWTQDDKYLIQVSATMFLNNTTFLHQTTRFNRLFQEAHSGYHYSSCTQKYM